MTMIPKNIVQFTHLVIATVGPYIYTYICILHILINTQTDMYIYISYFKQQYCKSSSGLF